MRDTSYPSASAGITEALRTSEMRYRRLFESARDGILIIDAVTRKITDVNPFMTELLGYSRDEFLGKELWEIGLLKDEEASAAAFAQLQEDHYIRYEDLPLQSKEGKRCDVEFVSNVYRENGHQVIQCNIRDITERKKNRAALLQAQRLAQATVDALPDNVAVIDEAGTIVAVNAAWREFGVANGLNDEASGIGANYLEVCDRSGMTEGLVTAAGIRAVIAGAEKTFRLEYPCYSPTEQRWFQIGATRFAGTDSAHVVVAHEDITARKNAEESLRLSEANLAKAQQIAHLGSWELDLLQTDDVNQNALRWSDEIFRIFGYEPGQIEVSNEAFFRGVHPDDRERIMAVMAQAVREGKPYRIDHRVVRPDGTERVVRSQAEMVLDESTGKPLRMIGTGQDITEQKQAEAKQSRLVQGLNRVVSVADELLTAPNLDHLLRQAVELAREKLGLERCAIFFIDRQSQQLQGTYGTTFAGETSDERSLRFPLTGFWAEDLLSLHSPDIQDNTGINPAANPSAPRKRWALDPDHALDEYRIREGQGVSTPNGATGWVAATPILSAENPIGVMFNDAAATHSPVDETTQELLVVYCSLLGNFIERLRTEERLQQVVKGARCLLWQAIVKRESDEFIWDTEIHNSEAAQEYLPVAVASGSTYADGFYTAKHEDDAERMTLAAQEALTAGKAGYTQEYRCRLIDDTIRWLYEEVRIEPQGPEQWRLVGVCTDITERKEAEAELLRMRGSLEVRVEERTAELAEANKALHIQIAEREGAEAETRTRARQQEAVAELGRRALIEADLNALLNSATELVVSTLNAELSTILELLPGGENFRIRAGTGWEASIMGSFIPADTKSQAGYALLHDTPTIVADLRTETRFEPSPLLLEQGAVSGITVVVGGYEKPFGTLGANSIQPNRFTQNDVHFLQAMSNVLAAALDQRRVQTEIRQLNTQLKQTNDQLKIENEERVLALDALNEVTSGLKRAKEEAEHAQENAERANRSKSEFLSRMSHELRTPLNAILGFGQILNNEDLTALQKESVGYVLKGGRHLLGLINEVLDISLVEAGRVELSIEPIALDDIVPEACALMRPLADERSISFHHNLAAPGQIHVLADCQRLKQVLINLLSNAIKYNHHGGQVVVTCELMPDERVCITVQDTGPGIPAENLSKLFTPFERLNAAKSDVEGTGLGLVLSQRLVTAMGGTLEAASIVGQGSSFSIELPQATPPTGTSESVVSINAGTSVGESAEPKYSVLCIEDNSVNLRLIGLILKRRPAVTLLSASKGSIGLDLARQHEPTLILLDLHLPDMSGQEVLAHLQRSAMTRDIPVVVISADGTPLQINNLLESGALAYLTKPLDVAEFLHILDEALEG